VFKENRKKILLVICLTLVLVISYSFINVDLCFDEKQENANKLLSESDDILLAATLDGEAIGEFPTVEDNYGVESITCNNGVTASFDPITWSVTVDGIKKSNTSCIVNFSSDITVDETSDAITMSKSDLYTFYKGSFASTATSSEVLAGKTVYLNGVEVAGSMPNNGSVTKNLKAGESYTIPKGYHDGTGVITSAPGIKSVTKTLSVGLGGYASGTISTTVDGTAVAIGAHSFSCTTSKGDGVLPFIIGVSTSGSTFNITVYTNHGHGASGTLRITLYYT